ncbi:hypothetical protein, partial [Salmonella enterica]|uniref:hypothetical protein n=1 Tax=Salmonella enterica TaxID=28901 RepID=UPI0032B329F9
GVLRDQLRDESPFIRQLFGLPILQPLYEAGVQAGYQNNLRGLVLIMVVTFFATLMLLSLLGQPLLALAAAPVMAYFVPYRHCMKRV